MTAAYVPAKIVSLKLHQDYNEKWLQKIIAEDPSALVLGELEVRQRRAPSAVRGPTRSAERPWKQDVRADCHQPSPLDVTTGSLKVLRLRISARTVRPC